MFRGGLAEYSTDVHWSRLTDRYCGMQLVVELHMQEDESGHMRHQTIRCTLFPYVDQPHRDRNRELLSHS